MFEDGIMKERNRNSVLQKQLAELKRNSTEDQNVIESPSGNFL